MLSTAVHSRNLWMFASHPCSSENNMKARGNVSTRESRHNDVILGYYYG